MKAKFDDDGSLTVLELMLHNQFRPGDHERAFETFEQSFGAPKLRRTIDDTPVSVYRDSPEISLFMSSDRVKIRVSKKRSRSFY